MDLAGYLKKRDIKAAVFAAEIGVPPSTISRILKGERDPRGATIRKIVDGSNGEVTSDELIGPTPVITLPSASTPADLREAV